MSGAFSRIKSRQLPAQPVHFDANSRVFVLFEIGRLGEYVDADCVFVNPAGFAEDGIAAQVLEQPDQSGRLLERPRLRDRAQLFGTLGDRRRERPPFLIPR
ncbi:MAG TPA: hypothetical protein VMJ34_19680 [Bryobacteraceae bacterium]|nr:hypothetical protein [Bryobacteraceae bacterium]